MAMESMSMGSANTDNGVMDMGGSSPGVRVDMSSMIIAPPSQAMSPSV